jgi:hypothetical protein
MPEQETRRRVLDDADTGGWRGPARPEVPPADILPAVADVDLAAPRRGARGTPVGPPQLAPTRRPGLAQAGAPVNAASPFAPTELGVVRSTLAWNELTAVEAGMAYVASLDPADAADRRRAARARLIIDAAARDLADGARGALWGDAGEQSKATADVITPAQGLGPHRRALRTALGLDLQAALADLADRAYDQLPAAVQRWARVNDIDASDWEILRAGAVAPMDADAAPLMDPARLATASDAAAREAAGKLMQALDAETQRIVPDEDVSDGDRSSGSPTSMTASRGRAPALDAFLPAAVIVGAGVQAMDAVARSDGGWFRGQYLAGTIVTLTALGALSIQLGALADGEEPPAVDAADGRFWARALVRGGGAELFGAFLARAGGPHDGTARHAAYDRYYTSLALDRLVWDALQNMADPDHRGAFQRAEERARAEDTEFWWGPGETRPAVHDTGS